MVFVIVAKLPSGAEMAFSKYQEEGKASPTFALVPFDEHGTVRGALTWDSFDEAEKHLNAQLKAAPKLREFSPFIRCMTEPS